MKRWAHLNNMLHREPWWAEMWSALAAIGWSRWVTWQTMDLSSVDLYRIVSSLATDDTWGWIGGVIGGFQLLALILDYRWARFVAAFFAASFWLCLAYSIWLANHSVPGVVLHLMQGVANMTSMVLFTTRRAR